MSLAVMTVVELADWSLGVTVVEGLTTTVWVEAAVLGCDAGALITEIGGRIVIVGSNVPLAGAAPELDDGLADVFDVGVTFGLGFGAGVLWVLAACPAFDGAV
jgi:hypothetical protein